MEQEATAAPQFEVRPLDDTPDETANDLDESTNETVEATSTEIEPSQEAQTTTQQDATADVVAQSSEAQDIDDDDDVLGFTREEYVPQGLDLSQLPTDEEGNIQPQAFQQAMAAWQQQTILAAQNQARQELASIRQEEKLWDKAFKEYPMLKDNKELRKTVQRARAGYVLDGTDATPLQAAKDVFKYINNARDSGVKQAQESVRVQRSAHLETASNTSDATTTRTQALIEQARSYDRKTGEAARHELLKQFIESGQIKTN